MFTIFKDSPVILREGEGRGVTKPYGKALGGKNSAKMSDKGAAYSTNQSISRFKEVSKQSK